MYLDNHLQTRSDFNALNQNHKYPAFKLPLQGVFDRFQRLLELIVSKRTECSLKPAFISF